MNSRHWHPVFFRAISLCLVLCVLGTGATLAQDDTGRFADLDVNGDGVLSGSEAASVRAYDQDGDGEVTNGEFDAGRAEAARRNPPSQSGNPQEAERKFQALDGNRDGRLSGTEMRGIEAYNANGDDRITLDEFLAAETRSAPADEARPGIIVTPLDEQPFAVSSQEHVRLVGSGIAGSKITIQIAGPAKLDRTQVVRTIVEGEPAIGGMDQEFELRPTGRGEVQATITVTYRNGSEPNVTRYRFTVR